MNHFRQPAAAQTFIGLDVAKDSLAVFIDSTNQQFEVSNQTQDLRRLAGQLKKLEPTLIVLEASGGYETLAVTILAEFALPYAVVYPTRVRQLAHGLGIIAKTDAIDARVIAIYGRLAGIQAQPLPSKKLRQLHSLTTRRQQLIEMRVAEENRLAVSLPTISRSIKKHLQWLGRQIAEVESQITELIDTDPELHDKDQLLQSVPGVGQVLSSILVTELPELGQLSNKQIASLVGVAPFPRESGKFKGRRYCRGGRNSIRKILYMATIAAARFNPLIKQFYTRLLEHGKIKKVALIACARKLITILNAMVKNNSDWNPKIDSISD